MTDAPLKDSAFLYALAKSYPSGELILPLSDL